MKYIINRTIFLVLLSFLLVITFSIPVRANNLPDFDKDGVPDYDEKEVYFTDYKNSDTDGDGYSDFVELINGYSPHNPLSVKLKDNDQDLDGLSDRMELNFKTNLIDVDTDRDGYKDGDEINNGYSPIEPGQIKLKKRIEINTGVQTLDYFLGGVKMGEFKISSGKPSMPTPKGHYNIINKFFKAWSSYGLWMPYWMGLGTGRFGLHQLPIWPNGYREGEDHLGQPVSHGCVRLGIEESEFLYNWAEVGTPVFIY